MESERHIHESIARKQSAQISVTDPMVDTALIAADCGESEFGDNVDLF
jgi:hypothetical protein